MTLVVTEPGPLAVIVDRGRPGYADIGVPPSGALDRPALDLANRLVGNPESAAGIELLLGGMELRAEASCVIAVTGPPVTVAVSRNSATRNSATRSSATRSSATRSSATRDPASQRSTQALGSHRAVYLAAGEQLVVGRPETGLRCYLAVRGGIDEHPVLGSRSTDLLSGLDPPPVQAGQELAVGTPQGEPMDADAVPTSVVPAERTVTVLLGPREDWFAEPAKELRAARWTVSPTSNRIGLRLDGPALTRRADRDGQELPSEPVLTGAVQVPPSGQPVIFLADHPTTGGYPVIGVVVPEDLPALAQARPGSALRLRPVSV